MTVAAFWTDHAAVTLARHPNELDLRRIEHALKSRARYRYVDPAVFPQEDGYLIRSACCSRNVDPEGGDIDIALMRWSDSPAGWVLYRRDHEQDRWIADSQFARMAELLARLNADPDRQFWQ